MSLWVWVLKIRSLGKARGHPEKLLWLALESSLHGRMNYKDTKTYMSAFLSVDLLTDFAAFCLTDFIDWRCTHSWFVFSTQLVNCCPPWMGRNYTCILLHDPLTLRRCKVIGAENTSPRRADNCRSLRWNSAHIMSRRCMTGGQRWQSSSTKQCSELDWARSVSRCSR